ncbi:MAG: hypothetical protein MHM6MM_002430 [Cercozoa sp. M6MM]
MSFGHEKDVLTEISQVLPVEGRFCAPCSVELACHEPRDARNRLLYALVASTIKRGGDVLWLNFGELSFKRLFDLIDADTDLLQKHLHVIPVHSLPAVCAVLRQLRQYLKNESSGQAGVFAGRFQTLRLLVLEEFSPVARNARSIAVAAGKTDARQRFRGEELGDDLRALLSQLRALNRVPVIFTTTILQRDEGHPLGPTWDAIAQIRLHVRDSSRHEGGVVVSVDTSPYQAKGTKVLLDETTLGPEL